MKKLFTLIALLTVFFGAKADTIVDAEVDFSKVTEIPRFSWGGSESAFARLSLQDGCLHFASTEATDPSWDCQFFPIGGVDAEVGVTYTLHFKVKGDHSGGVSMLGFGQTPYGQFQITTDWVEGTIDYQCTEANGNMLMQCGDWVGTWDIAYLKITHEGKKERPATWKELIVNGDAEKSWEELGLAGTESGDTENNYKVCFWVKEKGRHGEDGNAAVPAEIVELPEGGHAFICRAQLADSPNNAEGAEVSAWDNQIWIESPRAWKTGEQFKLSFRYKASVPVKTNTQYHKQNPGDYLYWQAIGDVSFTTEWQTFEQEVTIPADANGAWSVAFNLNPNNKDPMDFYIDDISWMEMELEHGYYVTATNTETGLVDYDFDATTEFVYNEEVQALEAIVGTAGKQESWVNEIMISTVRGNDRQYKANTLKPKGGALSADPTEWKDYEEAASAKIKLPASGVWKIYVDTELKQMGCEQIEGESPKEPLPEIANETEVIINTTARGEGNPWDNQFFLLANRDLKVGETVIVKFEYKADATATIGSQSTKGLGEYLGGAWDAFEATPEYQQFDKTYTVKNEGQSSFTFNLSEYPEATTYYFKNFVFMTEDMTETLMNTEGTAQLYIKQGAGTNPFEYGTDPDGIQEIVSASAQSNAVYNLAGQRVAKTFKGVAIKNGQKYVVK